MRVYRGEVYLVDFGIGYGSEQGGVRPAVIVQNNIGNKYSPTVICAALTSQINKAKLPTHLEISAERYGLQKDSVILLEQIRTIDKRRLREKISHADEELMERVDNALAVSLGIHKDQ